MYKQSEKEKILIQEMEKIGIYYKDEIPLNTEPGSGVCNEFLDKEKMEQFLQYYDLLLEWNQKINLTAITEFRQVVIRHFVDSLSICRLISPESGQKMIDVGTGAGFPGIPIKIMFPSLNITLLDSLGKRVTFLQAVIEKLNLKKIEAIHGRAEELARMDDYRGEYDYAVSRAVSNISTIAEYCVPFLKKNGCFIAYKSMELEKELSNHQGSLQKLGAELVQVDKFKIEDDDNSMERAFAVIKKIDETPEKYPRRSGIPEKRPL